MSETNNIPSLRFPEFRDEWRIMKFNEHCDFQQGIQVDVEFHKNEPEQGYSRFLRIENYTQKSKDFRFVPDTYDKKKHILRNDIVVVRYGATAGFIGRGFEGILANNLFKIIPDKNIFDGNYLFHFLKSYKAFHFFQSEMSGGAMPALSFGIVKALKIPITTLPEQQKIASFLTEVDTKIEQFTQKKALLEKYKKGVIQKIFSQEIRFKPAPNDPAYPADKYPDWKKRKLGEVLSIFNGYAFSSNESVDKGIPWVKIADVGIQKMKRDNPSYLPPGFSQKFKKFLLKEGEYVIALTRPILNGSLKIAQVDSYFDGSLLNQRVGKLITDQNYRFVYYLFQRRILINSIENNIAGTDPPNLSPSEINHIIVSLPSSLAEQTQIANFLSAIDDKIKLVSSQLENTQQFKKGLLQQMFV